MAQIETKFGVGDKVFAAEIAIETVQVPCPDCLGERTWDAKLPCGDTVKIQCQTCTYGYECRGTIGQARAEGVVRCYTVGSVSFDSWDGINHDRGGVRYMCEETGVGSGRVWDERDLYETREEIEVLLPELVAQCQLEYEEQLGRNHKIPRKTEAAGRMAAHYRAMIRDGKKQVESGERGLAREAGK